MRSRSVVRHPFWIFLLSAALFAGGTTPAQAAKKLKCKAGTVPVLIGSGTKAKVAKTKTGKPKCAKPPKLKASRLEPPATTSQGSVASAADQINQALTVDPEALDKIEQKVGKKATKALVDRTLNQWRSGMQARRLADDKGIHLNQTFGDPAKGTQGSAKLDASDVNTDGKLGYQASATVEFSADGKGLKELGADKVTDAKSAKVKLEVSFNDAPTACPKDGKVDGKLSASAKITITTDGASQTISAKVDSSYELAIGDDGAWKTIDNVDVQTEFQFGGTGEKTSTWRGRRVGSGFTSKGIFGEGSGDFTAAIKEQSSHINPNAGGIFGPQSGVNFAKGETPWDYKSISNIKGMIYTDIATTYLTYAAVEYIRKVVADRLQKNLKNGACQAKYTVTLADTERGVFATHDASASLSGTLVTAPVKDSAPAKSTASGPVTWSPLASASKIDICTIINPVSSGTWSVTVTKTGPETISVAVDFTNDTVVDYTFHCVDPPTPGCNCGPVITDNPLTGPRPIGFPRTPFTLPATGGTIPVQGAITLGSDGLFSNGTVTVTPAS